MSKAFSDLYDYVLPHVKGCDTPMADLAIKSALIEFLERSLVWTFLQTSSLPTVGSQATYVLSDLPAGMRVAQITDAWLDGKQIGLATETGLRAEYDNWQAETGTVKWFVSDENGDITLAPIPTTGGNLITARAAVTYLPTVTSFEDWIFNRFYEGLASGAMAKLYAMPSKPWSNAALHGKHLGDFESVIGSAGAVKSKGYTRAPLRSTPQFR